MRIGDLTRLEVDGVTLYLHLPYGQWRQLQRELLSLEESARGLDQLDALMSGTLLPLIKRVEGLEDAEGNPVEQLTPEVLQQLPATFLRELIAAVVGLGQEAPSRPPAPSSDR